MKETNMEHCRGEIEAVGYDFAIVDGKIVKCDSLCNGCELFDGGWIARDEEGELSWFEEKPTRELGCWVIDVPEDGYADLKKDYFPFITWEDEEPWSVEDLRKLKVGEAND